MILTRTCQSIRTSRMLVNSYWFVVDACIYIWVKVVVAAQAAPVPAFATVLLVILQMTPN